MISDSDSDILKKKEEVEEMWKSCSSKRERRTMASHGVPGYTLGGDNVGAYLI